MTSGGEAGPNICEQSQFAFTMPSESGGTAFYRAVDKKFSEIVRDYPTIGSLFVLQPTIGNPPGVIVAIELRDSKPNLPRQLQWLWETRSW